MVERVFLALCWLGVFVHFVGYILVLRLTSRRKTNVPGPMTQPNPPISLIVATYNEAKFIVQKLENLVTLSYPLDKLSVIFADGGSTDGTCEEISKFTKVHPQFKLIHCQRKGKIPQLNEAFAHIPQDHFVCITDADARICDPDALEHSIQILRNEDATVLGGWTMPSQDSHAHPSEFGYWDKQNRQRFLETQWATSSIVVAPFYIFPRKLIRLFPEDCVADDVFISFEAHCRGLRVVYSPEINIEECRQPHTLLELTKHKFRKTHAYTIELFRVLYRLPWMSSRIKFLYGMKLFQFFYLPFAIFTLLFFHVYSLLTHTFGGIFIGDCILVAMMGVVSSQMRPPQGKVRGGLGFEHLANSVIVLLIVTGVLIANFICFPFWKQNSSYKKVNEHTSANVAIKNVI